MMTILSSCIIRITRTVGPLTPVSQSYPEQYRVTTDSVLVAEFPDNPFRIYGASVSVPDQEIPDIDTRKEALARVTSQMTLGQVAMNDRDPEIRKMALSRVASQSVIEHVALNDPDPVIRRMAASRVTSVSVLERIAREGK